MGDDEPMPDAAPPPEAKPKRRFAPQLVEATVKSSTKKAAAPDTTPTDAAAASSSRGTKDASVQVNDCEMTDAPPSAESSSSQNRRRFAPVPIETTFDSYRVQKNPHGPTAELTPDPSPTSPSAPVPLLIKEVQEAPVEGTKPRRRFAPQLIESSRRARREGQEGPATKPTDKTDITPGTNHIYAPKAKRKPAPGSRPRATSAASAENDDKDSVDQSPRQLHQNPRRQGSMRPHYNTRRSTRSIVFHTDLDTIASSESESEPDEDDKAAVPALSLGLPAGPAPNPSDGETWASRGDVDLKNRRESCDEESSGYLLAVAAREAHRQREIEQALSAFPNGVPPTQVEHFFVRDSSEDDHSVEAESSRHGVSKLPRRKSTDPGWAAREMRQHAEKLARARCEKKRSMTDDSDMMDSTLPPDDPLWTTSGTRTNLHNNKNGNAAASSPRPAGSPSVAPVGKTAQPEITGFRSGPFGDPFAKAGNDKDDRELRRMRNAASPPMLGGDLKFRMCPSPQVTRMEPDHPYPLGNTPRPEEQNRDTSGGTGLWRGYCHRQTNQEVTSASLQPPALMATPGEPSTPADPFAMSFSASMNGSGAASPTRRNGEQKGLHMLSGLDGRLKMEKARREQEQKMAAEFNDAFVTQVYNYLSLGYPATARDYDEELSKITGMPVEELRRDDHKRVEKGFMLEMEMRVSGSGSGSGDDEVMRTPEEDEARPSKAKPPRWRALRLYIHEWARQHPGLFNEGGNQLAWGVRERRGSWAV